MLFLRLFFVLFSFSLALSPTLRAAGSEERKESLDGWSALPSVLLPLVCGNLTPAEVATKVRLVCSAWKHARADWDQLRSNSRSGGEEEFRGLFDLCADSGPRRLELDILRDCMLNAVCSRKNLRGLRLNHAENCDKHIGRLAELNLETLEIWGCFMDFTGATLSSLTRLKSLRIRCHEGNAWFRYLAACSELTNLCVSTEDAITDEDVGVLAASCPGLTELELSHYFVQSPEKSLTNDGMAHLGILKSVKKLTLTSFPNITDEGVAHLSKLELDELKFCFAPITGSTLSCLESLKILHLNACFWVDGVGLKRVAQLPELRTLYLKNSMIFDHELYHLSKSRSLKKLRLATCGHITNEGLPCLLNLKNLQSLEISECPEVTVDGGQYLLENRPELFLQYFIVFCILNPLQQAADETPSSDPMSLD